MRSFALAALGVAALAAGGHGRLDPSFGSHGKVVTAVEDGGAAQAIALQRDGKLVVAGFAAGYGTNGHFEIVRYTPRGRLDRHFGRRGKVGTDFGAYSYASAIKIQRDGKIVVAGVVVGSSEQVAVARYRPNGSLDSSFGAGGKVLEPGGGFALALQRDGKIVVGGEHDGAFTLYRLKRDGSLDAGFGTNGEVTTQFGFGFHSGVSGLAIQPNGKIVAVGHAVSPFELDSWALARYTRDGSLDPTFGSEGKVIAPFGGASAMRADAVVLQGSRRILVAGTKDGHFALAGFRPNGALDPSFGRDRGVSTAFDAGGGSAHALRQRGGRIVVAGEAFGAGNWKFALARFGRNGIPVTATTTSLSDGHDEATGLVVQRDGKIVVAGAADEYGYSGGMIGLVRYLRSAT
jgi:uncharacterized delta-60 repeat protein